MKISEKNLQLFLILLIVVIGFGAFQFGYSNFNKKAKALKTENQLLTARLAELSQKENSRSSYVETINGAGEQINDILSKYGPLGTKEKTIMFVSRLESESTSQISSISFSGDSEIYSSSQVDDNGVPVIRAYKKQITVDYQCQYANMKKMFDYINNYSERTNIDSFTMLYNQETGGINGSMIINQYSVDDANHIYEEPVITGVPLGKEKIFN